MAAASGKTPAKKKTTKVTVVEKHGSPGKKPANAAFQCVPESMCVAHLHDEEEAFLRELEEDVAVAKKPAKRKK